MKNENTGNFETRKSKTAEKIEISFTKPTNLITDTFQLFEPALKKYNILYSIPRLQSEIWFKITSIIDSLISFTIPENCGAELKINIVYNKMVLEITEGY